MSFIQQQRHFRQLMTDLDHQDTAAGLVSVNGTNAALTKKTPWMEGLSTVASVVLMGVYALILLVGTVGYGALLVGTCLWMAGKPPSSA